MGDEQDNCCVRFTHKLTRKKFVDLSNVTETKLDRCLTTLDLTALGKLTFMTSLQLCCRAYLNTGHYGLMA